MRYFLFKNKLKVWIEYWNTITKRKDIYSVVHAATVYVVVR